MFQTIKVKPILFYFIEFSYLYVLGIFFSMFTCCSEDVSSGNTKQIPADQQRWFRYQHTMRDYLHWSHQLRRLSINQLMFAALGGKEVVGRN